MLIRLVREPLVHFLAAAAAIFALYSWMNPSQGKGEQSRIVITTAKVEQLAGLFTMTWQRPPTPDEVKGLIDDYVKEEILVREAIALGIDKNDAVVRRRLRMKMEFLADVAADATQPTDAELAAYLAANPDKFRVEPMTSFQHVFLSPQRRGDNIKDDADVIYRNLASNRDIDISRLGDPTLLPSDVPPTSRRTIGQVFGQAFADDLQKPEIGKWAEPIASTFGLHVVRIIERSEGRLPELSDVRDTVAREWSHERRKQAERARFDALLKTYVVVMDTTAKAPGR
jgi:hypothetical protein